MTLEIFLMIGGLELFTQVCLVSWRIGGVRVSEPRPDGRRREEEGLSLGGAKPMSNSQSSAWAGRGPQEVTSIKI